MQTKIQPDEIESFLSDASFIRDGFAERVVLPESVAEVSEILARANRERVPVTVSGAGTGTVGGRVAFGGIILATDKLNHIKNIVHEEHGGFAVVEAGVGGFDQLVCTARFEQGVGGASYLPGRVAFHGFVELGRREEPV